MTAVENAITEIRQAMFDMASAHEGLYDFSRLNIMPETLAKVTAAIERYNHRRMLLETALNHLTALMDGGFPTLEPIEVTPHELKDLTDNATTIDAALARFVAERAASLGLEAGQTEPKG